MSRLPFSLKEKALNLRKKGYSIKEIAGTLNVSQSTSSLWVREVSLNKGAKRRLEKRRLLGYYKAGLFWKRRREEESEKYRKTALRVMNKIKKDSCHTKVYCALLYWCEGGKNSENVVSFVNSDPNLIGAFLVLLRKSFKVEEKKLRALMYLHDYHKEKKQKKFWAGITGISEDQFQKTYYKPNT